MYNHSTSTHSDSNMRGNDESDGSSVDNKSNRESVSENTGDEFYDDDDLATDEYFNELYVQYERDMRVKLDNQLKTLREEMRNRYLVKRGGNIYILLIIYIQLKLTYCMKKSLEIDMEVNKIQTPMRNGPQIQF